MTPRNWRPKSLTGSASFDILSAGVLRATPKNEMEERDRRWRLVGLPYGMSYKRPTDV